jgi:hypothetical protein
MRLALAGQVPSPKVRSTKSRDSFSYLPPEVSLSDRGSGPLISLKRRPRPRGVGVIS